MSYFKKPEFLLVVISLFLLIKVSFAQSLPDIEVSPYLKRIIANADSVIYTSDSSAVKLSTGTDIILKHSDDNLIFELEPSDSVAYQFFLEGFDKRWSGWKTTNVKEYTNLKSGEYKLKIRYIIKGSNGGEMSLVSLRLLPPWYASLPAVIIYIALFIIVIWVLLNFLNLKFAGKLFTLEQIINKRTEDLIVEKEKTEALLANVLPKNTASEIMEKGKATKIKYNFVTVLFSDIQGFTSIAEETNPEILIDELDKFFFYFDSVVEKFGIEKIKTIGDAYMCAGGIPEKNRTNPVEVILAALEMKAYMKRLKETSEFEGMKYWDIRIGIHTGTVVAGVVGQKKLSYDIWGDTVNTASRMESSGEGGKINISGTTYEFVKEFFNCEFRGKMPVKYKGELEMYFVNSILKDLSNEDGSPNRQFIIKMQLIKLQDIEERVLKIFEDDAPPNLYFHNSSLVRNITNQVELLSRAEAIPEEDYINLKLAAVFLFTGFITDYDKPMQASVRMVEEILPAYGFDKVNIDETSKLIGTCYAGCQNSLADNILHDARFDYLGRLDYPKLTEKLLREMTEYGKLSNQRSWIEYQTNLLRNHEFITQTAKLLRSVPAEEQIAGLQGYVNKPNS